MVGWRLCSLAVCAATMLLSAQVSADSSRRFGAQSSAVVTIKKDSSSFFGTNAYDKGWGAKLKDQTRNKNGDLEFFQLVYTTASLTDPFGCTAPEVLKNASSSKGTTFTVPSSGSFILLVDRGHCSFTEKALHAQQLGAVGVIITDTQQQAYNRTLAKGADEISRAMEYSCANGRGEVPDKVDMTDFASNPEKWAEDVNVKRCTTNSFCESNLCIPTGKGRQVCCLWDIAEQMDFSNVTGAENPEDITIAVVRLKIADGMELKTMLANTTESLQLVINDRHTPRMDPSSFIIWLLAIITVMTGGYKGATIERQRAQRKQSAAALLLQNRERGAGTVTENRNGGEFSPRTHAAPPSLMNESIRTGTTAVDHSAALEEELLEDDDTMDLNVYHAIFFVVFATVFLLILFYWNVVIVVIVLFAVGSVSCTFYILWQPLYHKLSFLHHRPFKTVTAGFWAKFEPDRWSVADMLAVVTALFMAVLWFLNRNRHYAWILQDTFGVCLSILFLRTIRLPNLKIATCMLVLVFLYDIFMVFISPYIFKKSVMISVATGGSQAAPTVSSGYCLRYPQDTAHHCLKEQIPILLRFPKVIDWRDGQSMLGLGDIVLPGLLIVFCARFDYATRGQLLGRVKAPHLARLKAANNPSETVLDDDQQNQQNQLYHNQQMPELTTHGVPDASRRGLFGILMWGYAIGLLGANIGVMLMKQGQPALMYLVPTTLGTLVIVAWRRGILRKLWDGPEEFKMRDPSPHHHHARSMTQGTLRDRGFTVDHVMDTPGEDMHDIVVVDGHSDATPHSTYARPEDTPRRQTLV